MAGPAPLLRSPRFPWTRGDAVPVSLPLKGRCGRLPWSDERYQALLGAIRSARVGGAFWAAPAPFSPDVVLRPRDYADAVRMGEAALRDFGTSKLLAVLPPARWSRKAAVALARMGVAATTGPTDPWSVLKPRATVHARADDEYALLGTIAGCTIACPEGREEEIAVRLRHALLDAASYRDPFHNRIVSPERAVAILAQWREVAAANRGIAAASGVAWWKRRAIDRLLWCGDERATPVRRSARSAIATARARNGAIAAWPARMPATLTQRAAATAVPLIRIEDGFIRSAGLGADLQPPHSIVVDRDGAHYDPSRRSTLEQVLSTADFPPPLIARAERLIARLVDARIGKYGVEPGDGPSESRSGRRVLVAGQVEDDLSVRLGGAGIDGNRALLQRVRRAEPDSEIWFRPHPDVVAGHRAGAVTDPEARTLADRVVPGGSLATLLDHVDCVHVLTSQTGFEALLRGRPVVTHGHPFYAGWGLTTDLAGPVARRTRRLTLAQLVAGTLILYPRYLDPVTGVPCPVEVLVDRLAQADSVPPGLLVRARRFQGRLRLMLAGAAA